MIKRRISRLCSSPTILVSMLMVLLLSTSFAFSTARAAVDGDQLTGAIWTTDSKGKRVNGNLFTNPRGVYLTGGPFKVGGLGLPDGDYYFQVTNPAGTMVLSTDSITKRKFTVTQGSITAVDDHNSKNDPIRGGLLVQLWPFDCSSDGGAFKVWVTRVQDWNSGFIPSLSKTDNFKVKLDETVKLFELWTTSGVNEIDNVVYYVNYTTSENPTLWTNEQLFEDRIEGTLTVFQDGTTFPVGISIYWKFEIYANSNLLWASEIYGPELVVEGNMVNTEVVFRIDGHKYDADGIGLSGWYIALYKNGQLIEEVLTDSDGYYYFIASVPGNYRVLCQGLGTEEAGETWYEFAAESGVDKTFDFHDSRKILNIGNLQGVEISLFEVVFTPSGEDSDLYKFSSTNPGSFHLELNLEDKYDPGTVVTIEFNLPSAGANNDPPDIYDSPNFILHHAYKGDTPTVDIHIYADDRLTSEITEDFSIDSNDGMVKHVRISGVVPSSGSLFVRVHLDYQIDGLLTWQQVLSFQSFTYPFDVVVIDNVFGVRRVFGVR